MYRKSNGILFSYIAKIYNKYYFLNYFNNVCIISTNTKEEKSLQIYTLQIYCLYNKGIIRTPVDLADFMEFEYYFQGKNQTGIFFFFFSL